MSYRVVWRTEPFDVMGQIIRHHSEHRPLLAHALRDLSEALRTNPTEAGESREGDVRIDFFHPLAVTFRVFEADREVHIVEVRLTSLLL